MENLNINLSVKELTDMVKETIGNSIQKSLNANKDQIEKLKKEEEEKIQANAAAENRNSTSSEKTIKTTNSGLGNQIAENRFAAQQCCYGEEVAA